MSSRPDGDGMMTSHSVATIATVSRGGADCLFASLHCLNFTAAARNTVWSVPIPDRVLWISLEKTGLIQRISLKKGFLTRPKSPSFNRPTRLVSRKLADFLGSLEMSPSRFIASLKLSGKNLAPDIRRSLSWLVVTVIFYRRRAAAAWRGGGGGGARLEASF